MKTPLRNFLQCRDDLRPHMGNDLATLAALPFFYSENGSDAKRERLLPIIQMAADGVTQRLLDGRLTVQK